MRGGNAGQSPNADSTELVTSKDQGQPHSTLLKAETLPRAAEIGDLRTARKR
jgi:hypothetical protein